MLGIEAEMLTRCCDGSGFNVSANHDPFFFFFDPISGRPLANAIGHELGRFLLIER